MRSEMKKWVKLACGMAFALIALGACTLGEDLLKEYTAKAQQGDPAAQYQLARLYFEANGVDQSDKKGEFWLRKSADQGYADAQTDLGGMYSIGVVVRKNPVEADKWFILASRQGHGPGTRYMKDIEDTMTPEQIEKAKALANDWTPKRN
jgi:uncharacterized protein